MVMSCKYLLQRSPGLGTGRRRGPPSVSGLGHSVNDGSVFNSLCNLGSV